MLSFLIFFLSGEQFWSVFLGEISGDPPFFFVGIYFGIVFISALSIAFIFYGLHLNLSQAMHVLDENLEV